MLIDIAGIKLNLNIHNPSDNLPVLIMLHGFTGSGEDWNETISFLGEELTYATVDLIGHGKSNSPLDVENYKAESIAGQIYEIVKRFKGRKIALLGYSMGGRAALMFATVHPEMVDALIFESTTAGIDDDKTRLERKISDEALAEFIESHTMSEFVDRWMNQEMFKSQRKLDISKLNKLRQSRLNNNPIGLANTLKGFGTGVMPALYDRLYRISCPVLLVTGQLDEKFSEINRKISQVFPNAEHVIIGNAGHNVHLEQPQEFSRIVKGFLIRRLLK